MNNRYTIQRELGQGGMAIVHLAEDTRLHSPVALKVLRKEMASNSHIHKRFVSEARSMFRMAHPNIIKVIDLIDDDDTVAIVMEYVEGETLKQYLDRKSILSDYEIKDLLAQMLDALEYVHEQGLVHRDIKPSNFMITPKGKVKLMDFGIAKQTDSNSSDYTSTGTTQQMGTPMYMSPEQIHETKNVTAQSDIYSLGVVLWQMVTGKRPYDTQTLSTFQLQSKIVNEPLVNTNTKWDPIIHKATAKEITQRYSSAAAFKKALFGEYQEADSTIINDSTEPHSSTTNQEKHKVSYTNTENSPRITNQTNTKRNKVSNETKLFFSIFGAILFGILLYTVVESSKSSYSEGDYYMSFDSTAFADSVAAVAAQAAADSAAAAAALLDGQKKVKFINNTDNKIWIAIAFFDNDLNDWRSIGWYSISPYENFVYDLPYHFTDDKIYFYGDKCDDSNKIIASYNGSDAEFYVEYGEFFDRANSDWEKGQGKKGFHKIVLTNSFTEHSLNE